MYIFSVIVKNKFNYCLFLIVWQTKILGNINWLVFLKNKEYVIVFSANQVNADLLFLIFTKLNEKLCYAVEDTYFIGDYRLVLERNPTRLMCTRISFNLSLFCRAN